MAQVLYITSGSTTEQARLKAPAGHLEMMISNFNFFLRFWDNIELLRTKNEKLILGDQQYMECKDMLTFYGLRENGRPSIFSGRNLKDDVETSEM